ncbi:hypothetical protein E6P97_02375 [Patescibacteria group bacterium]|nr:MAG: hypothetical protein E6P97_02375 [Patescibacteria group bacterium]
MNTRMHIVTKILLWSAVIFCGLMTIGGLVVTLSEPEYRESPALPSSITAIFAIATTGAALKLRSIRRNERAQRQQQSEEQVAQSNGTDNQQMTTATQVPAEKDSLSYIVTSAFRWYVQLLKRPFSILGIRRLATTNGYMKAGRGLLIAVSAVWLVLAIAPIILTIIQARASVADDPSSSGPAGMVVFSIILLAPLWGILVASWLALPAFICMITGFIKAKGVLHSWEYVQLVLALMFTAIALLSIRILPEIVPFYQSWFLPWTVSA